MEKELGKILDGNKDRRVCVVGVSCSGKSTLIKNFPDGVDLDELSWATMPKKIQESFSGQKEPIKFEEMRERGIIKSWTAPQWETWENHVYKTAREFEIKPGQPVFSAVVFDKCDLVVYLDISEKLLRKRAIKRGRDAEKILRGKTRLESIIADKKLPVVKIMSN